MDWIPELKPYAFTALELIVGFVGLFLYTKLLGKAHFTQLTPFDFISVLVLGELLGNAVYDEEMHLGHILFSTALWALLIFTLVLVTQKWNRSRKALEGEPTVVIRRGRLDYEAMRRCRIDLNELQTLLRQKDVFSMEEVEYAVMETNGMLSVMRKPQYEQPERRDLKLNAPAPVLPVTLILDGKLQRDNLAEAGVDEAWLKQKMQNAGAAHYSEVFFAEWNGSEEPYICLYESPGRDSART